MGVLPDPASDAFATNFDYDSSEEQKFDEGTHLGLLKDFISLVESFYPIDASNYMYHF